MQPRGSWQRGRGMGLGAPMRTRGALLPTSSFPDPEACGTLWSPCGHRLLCRFSLQGQSGRTHRPLVELHVHPQGGLKIPAPKFPRDPLVDQPHPEAGPCPLVISLAYTGHSSPGVRGCWGCVPGAGNTERAFSITSQLQTRGWGHSTRPRDSSGAPGRRHLTGVPGPPRRVEHT